MLRMCTSVEPWIVSHDLPSKAVSDEEGMAGSLFVGGVVLAGVSLIALGYIVYKTSTQEHVVTTQ